MLVGVVAAAAHDYPWLAWFSGNTQAIGTAGHLGAGFPPPTVMSVTFGLASKGAAFAAAEDHGR